jgi:muconolactone D-isomerase
MEYLVGFTIEIPDGTPRAEADRRARAETERVDALAKEGVVLRVWRPMPCDDRRQAIGLYRADDEAALRAILESLPLYPWMTIEMQALAPHPNDPAAVTR